jgi:hypothetical protein
MLLTISKTNIKPIPLAERLNSARGVYRGKPFSLLTAYQFLISSWIINIFVV